MPPGTHHEGITSTDGTVCRSPCGVAQCLALSSPGKARTDYGTHKQPHQIIVLARWASGRGYSTLAVAICKTRILLVCKQFLSTLSVR